MVRRSILATLAGSGALLIAGAGTALAAGGSQFSLLDRPATEADTPHASFGGPGGYASPHKCDWSGARRGSSDVWLIPSRDGSAPCLGALLAYGAVVAAGGPREVQPTGLYVTGHRVGHDPMILGAVPDGIASLRLRLANGATRHVPVVDNTYRASVPSRVVGIEVTSADGVRTSAPVASPKRHGHGKHKPRKRKPRKRR